MKIVKHLTPYNFSDKNDPKRIFFIVVHYFGSLGTAKAVADYFANDFRGASAHYSVDENPEVYQSVNDDDIAWHCGTSGKYVHQTCRNHNSLGIEMRPKKRNPKSLGASDKDWYFDEATLANTAELVKQKMLEYNVPIDRVIRHYDVTGKICPNPFVVHPEQWIAFKERLKEFVVQVTATSLTIRSGPGTQYGIKGTIRDKGRYTIVEVQGKWGRLKSGAGWIHLDYTKR